MTGRAQTERTRQRARDAFLAELAKCANISDAANAANVGRSTVYQWRDEDPEFAAAWEVALEQAIDSLEKEAWRRARDGVQEPVIGRIGKDRDGQVTDQDGNPLYIRKYSDTLMTKLLQAHRPEKYRERHEVQGKHEISGMDGNPIRVEHVIPDDQLDQFISAFTQNQAYRGADDSLADDLPQP